MLTFHTVSQPRGTVPTDSSTKFRYYGGHPALDLVNTVEFRHGSGREEMLVSIGDLIDWARGAGILDQAAARAVERWGRAHPAEAEPVVSEVRDLRELAARLFEAVIDERRPAPRDLARLNELAGMYEECRIAWTGEGYRWTPPSRHRDAHQIRRDAVKYVLELLTSDDLRRVARCQDDRGCGWLFLDRSRAGNRRWCSMAECGNRAKVRSFTRRARGT